MGVRRQSREWAVQAIYMCDFHGAFAAEQVALCFDYFGIPKAARPYAEALCRGVLDNLEAIDTRLTSASEHWSVARMNRVDRSILRVTAFEILYCPEVPFSVAIDEAIEIAKSFGSDESPNFVNGVLDKLAAGRRSADTPLQSVRAGG